MDPSTHSTEWTLPSHNTERTLLSHNTEWTLLSHNTERTLLAHNTEWTLLSHNTERNLLSHSTEYTQCEFLPKFEILAYKVSLNLICRKIRFFVFCKYLKNEASEANFDLKNLPHTPLSQKNVIIKKKNYNNFFELIFVSVLL